MQEFNWIEKLNEDSKTGEISISIKGYRNIKKSIKFKFVKGGTTIIIGKNNVGKTNILDYIYEEGVKWNRFEEDSFKKDKKANYIYKNLPLFFGNNKPIFFEKYEKILSLTDAWFSSCKVKELNIKYFYKIYYLNLKTFFSFLDNEFEDDETPKKIKIGGCNLKYIENFDEQTLEKKNNSNSLIWKEKIEEKEESWKIRYSRDSAEGIEKIITRESDSVNYKAINESTDEPHGISTIGSGHLKSKKLEALIKTLTNEQEKNSKEIFAPILLIDELELLLHPPLIAEVSNLVKKLKKNNITTIFTTHSPTLLSQFIHEDKTVFAIAKSEKDKRKKFLLGEIVYFWDLVREMKENIEETWKNYCDCLKSRISNDNNFYHNHWKSLLNEYTLKIFFSEKILFVEGINDYILFTSNLLLARIPELKKLEIVPIFGKSNYIFFKSLAEKLGLNYWFILDMDKHYIKKGLKQEEEKEEKNSWKCNREKLNTCFWYQHKGELEKIDEIKNGEIIHSKLSRITWFSEDMESFLLPKEKGKDEKYWEEHKWIRKEARIVGNISSEDFITERFEKMKEELKEVAKWIKEGRKWDNFLLPAKEIHD